MSFIELFWKNGSCAQRPCDSNGVIHKSVRCSVPGKVGVPVSKTVKYLCARNVRANVVFVLNDASCCFITIVWAIRVGLFELGLLRLGLGL